MVIVYELFELYINYSAKKFIKKTLAELRQGAVSHGRPVLTGRNGESAAARRSGAHKNEEAPRHVGRGPRESSGDLLSRARGPGTIGDLRLNFRVRDGNGCDPHSITAETNSCMEPKTFCNRQSSEARRVRAAHAGQ